MIKDAESLLREEEDERDVAYLDSEGKPTIGIGHYDPRLIPDVTTWTAAQVAAQFEADFIRARDGIARAWPAILCLDVVRQAYVVSMAFQLGVAGVLGFPRLLAALSSGAWQGAHDEALHSKWHKQTPARCERAAAAFFSGQWQQIA